jgi:hypothetical protein
VTAHFAEEAAYYFASRYTWYDEGVTAVARTNTACVFFNPYDDASAPSYFNYCFVTLSFDENYDVDDYPTWHYAGSFDFSACKPGESYTFLVCSLWQLDANGQWHVFKVQNISTDVNSNDWW